MTWLFFLLLNILLIVIALSALVIAIIYWKIVYVKIAPTMKTVMVGKPCAQGQPIPKIIWAYWDNQVTPDLVQRCQKKWRLLAPDYEIRVLHKDNMHTWLPAAQAMPVHVAALPPFRQADWLRLQLLAHYGGFWIDSTIILIQPLDWLHNLQQQSRSEYVGFYIDLFTTKSTQPIIENWFMAAVPASAFISDLLQEFTYCLQLGEAAYLHEVRSRKDFDQIAQALNFNMQEYLIMHIAAAKLIHDNPAKYSLALVRAEDTAFSYHAALNWSKRKLYIKLALTTQPEILPPLIKLRGNDRRRIEYYLSKGWFFSGSLLGKQLLLHRH